MSKGEGNRMRQHTPNTDRARSRRTQLATALESLPDLDRLVLSLYLLEGLSVLEIAGALKLTTREVEQLRVAALATIAKGLGKDVNGRRAA